MGYKSRRTGRYERSNPLGAMTFVNDTDVRNITNKLRLEQYDPTPLIEPGREEIVQIKHGKQIPIIYVPDGGNYPLETDRQNTIEFVSICMLKIRSDFEPVTTTNVRQEIRNDMTRHKVPMPIKGAHYEDKTVFETLSSMIFEELSKERYLLDTYKWLLYRKWSDKSNVRREEGLLFRCPYCGTTKERNARLQYDADDGECIKCKHLIYVTDYFIGYNRRMGKGDDMDSIPAMYMVDMEMLILVAEIRRIWENQNERNKMSDYLFVKDGQLQFRDHDIGDSLVNFIKHAYKNGCHVNMVSQEKSGKFYDHIEDIQYLIPSNHVFIPSDRYTKVSIQQRDEHLDAKSRAYGSIHNVGVKIFVKFNNGHVLVLSLPSGGIRKKVMRYDDLIGISDIITTIEKCALVGDTIKWIRWAHSNASIKSNVHRTLDRNLFHNHN